MAAKKTTKKKPAAKKAAGKAKAPAKKEAITAADVNLGHVFALRPRVNASFAPERFRRAKDLLAEETYKSVADAARAVAEKALETSQKGPPKRRG